MDVRPLLAGALWALTLAAAGWAGWWGTDQICRQRAVPVPSGWMGAAAGAGLMFLVHAAWARACRPKRKRESGGDER